MMYNRDILIFLEVVNMKLLLDNAYLSWRKAIEVHDKIENGLSTLNYQKEFVASLHNAVEIFLKQIMLDNNDHSVMPARNNKNNAGYSSFQASSDLNSFFKSLTSEEISKYYSISFFNLISKHKDLLKLENTSFQKELTLLQSLRNNETHFFMCQKFLSENDFIILHNFMIDFYEAILDIGMFPMALSNFESGENFLPTKLKLLDFKRDKLNNNPPLFSYFSALTSSHYYKLISDILKEYGETYISLGSTYSVAKYIISLKPELEGEFLEIFSFLQLAFQYDLIEFTKYTNPTQNSSDFISDEETIYIVKLK